jgi:hypothetical protein
MTSLNANPWNLLLKDLLYHSVNAVIPVFD